ncbi:MAG: hypothetical protein AAB438_03070 [Patescibacteria group bacterium]
MIYLFAGDDTDTKIKSYEKFLSSISKNSEVFYISKNNFSQMEIESFYSGAGLFFSKCTIVFSDILDREETREYLLEKLEFMASSQNDFLFLESKLTKVVLDAFKKARAELNVFELPKEKKEKFNNFLLANALGDKDKLNLWIYYRQAVDKGVGLEELIGVLFWKVKDMILKKHFNKLSEEQLKDIGNNLSFILPKARKEGKDPEVIFEKFLLEIF